MIEIYAGKNALKQIEQSGFNADLFTSFLGASGGPKWFTLYGLDKYIFAEFFKDRSDPINIVGSSAGGYRAACIAQKDPIAALERMAKIYSETVYPKNATPTEVTDKARDILAHTFGPNGVQEVIDNPIFKAHFIVAKCRGMVSSENLKKQGVGLLKSYLLNRVGRHKLKKQYERFVFHSNPSTLKINDPFAIPTHYVPFSPDNLVDAVLASGSIPMVMEGIRDIAGCPKGMYRDGGIIDYHFDFKITTPGLTLYPHFSAKPKAGWFDKNLPRSVSSENYDNTVFICPSEAFVKSLPYGKIPDRKDFTTMDDDSRIKYWQQALVQTEQMADDLDRFITAQDISKIKAFG